jgi:protein-S-isoprenylcysteine O-methyltransferase Ste14
MVYLAELFPTTTAASIFFVVYALWLLSELVIGGIIPRSRRHGTPIRYEDRSSRLLISLSMFLSLMIAFLFAASGIASLPSGAFYLGIGLMIAGILLRQWSIAVLGRYFSRTVGVQEGQAVVDRGPYRLVRHPAYTGSLLTMVGLGFVLQSWGAGLVLIAFFGVAFGYRIHVEEAVLTSKLGDEYVAYAKKTKRLIPYVL